MMQCIYFDKIQIPIQCRIRMRYLTGYKHAVGELESFA